jgi:hypothetical protein
LPAKSHQRENQAKPSLEDYFIRLAQSATCLKGIMSATNRMLQIEGTVIDAGTGGRVEIDGTAELNKVGLFDIRDNLARDNVINPVRSPTFKKFRDAVNEW